MKRTPEDEIKRLKAALQFAIHGLKELATPCTRTDYHTAAELDSVVCRIANERLGDTLTALLG